MKTSLLSLLVMLAMGLSLTQAQTYHAILLIGDSTVEERRETHPSQGWGAFLGKYLNPPWKVVNCAKSGASTKTFLETPQWARAQTVSADYLFIQFGHNDSHGAGRPESTNANTDYRDYLKGYIEFARSRGIKPVLIAPMHRRTFYPDGRLKDILKPYAEAVKAVAAEMNVPVIDLHEPSGKTLAELGDAGSEDLFAPNDRTHFSRKGADWLAAEVARQAAEIDPVLKEAFAPKP